MHAVYYNYPIAHEFPSCYACGSSFPSYPQGMQGWETPMSDPYSSYEPSLIGNPESQTHSGPTGRDSVLTDFEDGKVGLPIRITCIPAAGLPSRAQKFRRGFPNPQFSRSDHSSLQFAKKLELRQDTRPEDAKLHGSDQFLESYPTGVPSTRGKRPDRHSDHFSHSHVQGSTPPQRLRTRQSLLGCPIRFAIKGGGNCITHRLSPLQARPLTHQGPLLP